jgi:hypothetical protein
VLGASLAPRGARFRSGPVLCAAVRSYYALIEIVRGNQLVVAFFDQFHVIPIEGEFEHPSPSHAQMAICA